MPEGFKDIDELANTADGKKKFDEERKKSQDGFLVIFQNMKKKFDLSSPIDKQKVLNMMFNLILNIHSSAMQDHYIQVLGEKLGINYEIMRAQYVQYAKSEGKYILQQAARKKEAKYEIDREMLVAALFYQEFIKQYIEIQEKRKNIFALINVLMTTLPDILITQTANNPDMHEPLVELQLRRDKELTDKDEDKKYQSIKQIIMPILQKYVKRITKDPTISNNEKQHILNLTRNI